MKLKIVGNMALERYTQNKIDSLVLGIAEHQVNLTTMAVRMKRQGDPDARRREEESIMLMNILDALKNYDVTWDTLIDDDVDFLIGLGTTLVEVCPI